MERLGRAKRGLTRGMEQDNNRGSKKVYSRYCLGDVSKSRKPGEHQLKQLYGNL
jgi:hypothetical protein